MTVPGRTQQQQLPQQQHQVGVVGELQGLELQEELEELEQEQEVWVVPRTLPPRALPYPMS